MELLQSWNTTVLALWQNMCISSLGLPLFSLALIYLIELLGSAPLFLQNEIRKTIKWENEDGHCLCTHGSAIACYC